MLKVFLYWHLPWTGAALVAFPSLGSIHPSTQTLWPIHAGGLGEKVCAAESLGHHSSSACLCHTQTHTHSKEEKKSVWFPTGQGWKLHHVQLVRHDESELEHIVLDCDRRDIGFVVIFFRHEKKFCECVSVCVLHLLMPKQSLRKTLTS